MTKRDFGEITGKCSVCAINLWSSSDNKPVVFPCNLEGCPYEDRAKQHKHNQIEFSFTGSGLAQLD
jgi:hypothetical protein